MLEIERFDLDEIAFALADQNLYDEHRHLINPESGEIVLWTREGGIDSTNPIDLDDLGQFAEMTGSEDPTGDSDLAGDGRLNGQRSSICDGCLRSDKPFPPELRFLHQMGHTPGQTRRWRPTRTPNFTALGLHPVMGGHLAGTGRSADSLRGGLFRAAGWRC